MEFKIVRQSLVNVLHKVDLFVIKPKPIVIRGVNMVLAVPDTARINILYVFFDYFCSSAETISSVTFLTSP